MSRETQFVFKYVYQNDDYTSNEFCNNKEVNVTLNGDQNLTQLLEEFKGFLQSCGYAFHINDRLDVVNDFGWEEESLDDQEVLPETSEVVQEPNWEEFRSPPPNTIDGGYIVGGGSVVLPEIPKVSSEADDKLTKLTEEIIPFLENLKEDPEKVILRWPNRAEVIQNQIDKIKIIVG